MTDKAREEFEAWLVKSNRSCASARNDSGGYNHYGTQSCWEAWQASRRVGAAAMIDYSELKLLAQRVIDLEASAWDEFESAATPSVVLPMITELESRQWRPIETCPKHKDVLFYRADSGVFTGQLTYCEAFMSEKEVEESDYDEQTLYAEDVFSFGPDGAYRCDGDLVPTHWMPFPADPQVTP